MWWLVITPVLSVYIIYTRPSSFWFVIYFPIIFQIIIVSFIIIKIHHYCMQVAMLHTIIPHIYYRLIITFSCQSESFFIQQICVTVIPYTLYIHWKLKFEQYCHGLLWFDDCNWTDCLGSIVINYFFN